MINKIIANIRKGVGKTSCYVARYVIAFICFTSITANAAVYYVTPEADGTGGGTSWSDATTLAGANGKVAAGDTIRMKAGTYTMTATVTISKAITVEGGYKGEVDGDLTLADTPESVLDGEYKTAVPEALQVTSGAGVTNYFYRLAFTRCDRRGFLKKGDASLEMYDCRFANNAPQKTFSTQEPTSSSAADITKGGGRGGYFLGRTSDATLVLSNCVFEGNVCTNSSTVSYWSPGYGIAANISLWKAAYLNNCKFLTNGIPFAVTSGYPRYLKGAALFARNAPIIANGCEFRGNSSWVAFDKFGGICYLTGSCGGSVFKNCLWAGNRLNSGNVADKADGAGVIDIAVSASAEVNFENCTVAYNIVGSQRPIAAGIMVSSGVVNIKNSILYGNVMFVGSASNIGKILDPDICVLSANASVNLINTLTSQELTNDDLYLSTTSCTHGNPDFITPIEKFYACINGSVNSQVVGTSDKTVSFKKESLNDVMNFDVHLRSTDGYFDNSGKYYPKGSTDVSSIAIDAGALESDYSKEPIPNGGVVNLGCYGNTPEASNSPSGGQPTLAADDVVVNFTEYGKPTVTVTPKSAEESVKYKASVSISVTGKVKGGGLVLEETKTYDFVQAGITPGTTVEMLVEEIFEPSSQLLITVTVTSDGAQDVFLEKTVTVSGSLPDYYGRGNENVVHYWADAPGRNDGSSWVNAYRDLSSAIAALTPEKSELWIAGSNVLHASTATLASSFNSTVRGGFTEYCNTLEERKAGAISVLDGDNKYAPFAVSVSSGFTCFIERMKFCRAGTRNITKSNAGNLHLSHCVVSDCDKSVQGSGIYLSGGENTFDSCEFKNLKYAASTGTYPHSGAAMYATGAKNVMLENCSFEGNGTPETQNHRDAPGGSAIYSFDTPLKAKGIRFLGNVERTEKHSSNFRSAGCVTLNGNCGGSVFTNCLWLGNCGTYSGSNLSANGVGTSTNTAAVVVNLSSANSTVDFANCTFAYNMSDSALSSTGILLLKGKGNAVNSIFTGAVTGAYSRVANQVYVNKGSSMTLDYCMFDAEGDYGAAEGGTVTASNIMYADPRLVYSRDDFASGGNVDMVNGIYKSNGSGIASVLANANAHLRGGSGYTDENTGLVVTTYRRDASPAIDAGKPGYDYSLEPMPNGRRVNLGFYGNTPWATMSDRRGMKIIIR